MRPRRYPYSGKRKSLATSTIKISCPKAVNIRLDSSSLAFSEDKIVIKGQSITGV